MATIHPLNYRAEAIARVDAMDVALMILADDDMTRDEKLYFEQYQAGVPNEHIRHRDRELRRVRMEAEVRRLMTGARIRRFHAEQMMARQERSW